MIKTYQDKALAHRLAAFSAYEKKLKNSGLDGGSKRLTYQDEFDFHMELYNSYYHKAAKLIKLESIMIELRDLADVQIKKVNG